MKRYPGIVFGKLRVVFTTTVFFLCCNYLKQIC